MPGALSAFDRHGAFTRSTATPPGIMVTPVGALAVRGRAECPSAAFPARYRAVTDVMKRTTVRKGRRLLRTVGDGTDAKEAGTKVMP